MRRNTLWVLIFLSAPMSVNCAPVDADIDKACNVVANVSRQIATNRLQGVSKSEAISRVRSKIERESQDLFLAVINGVYEPTNPPIPDNVRRESYDGCVEGFSGQPRHAGLARHEVVLKCSLVYGSLFMSSRKAGHTELLAYSQGRVRVIAPDLQSYKGNPNIERDFKRIAQENRPLIDRLERDFYDAITARDIGKFRSALKEVSACDLQLGIRDSQIPLL